MSTALLETARTRGVPAQVLEAVTEGEIEAAFESLKSGNALLVGTDPSYFVRRAKLVALPARHSVPAMFDNSEAVAAGGLVSYGASIEALWERAGANVARILKDEKPANLPVEQATKLWLASISRPPRRSGLRFRPSS